MTAYDHAGSYGRGALDGLLSDLAGVGDGERNATLNRVAYRAGRLVAAGVLDGEVAAREIEAGALALGLSPNEVTVTLRSGLRAGRASPASVPDDAARGPSRDPARPSLVRPAPPEQGPAPRPTQAEVEELWQKARPVAEDLEVAEYLRGRSLDPARVELYDLARALPDDAKLWRWARCGKVWWRQYHRLIVRGFSSTGNLESLHARVITSTLPRGLSKALWPAAGPGSARGLVFACGLGQQLLAGVVPTCGTHREVVVSEGATDWLSWATSYSDANLDAPAIFGFTAGGWSQAIADRIPPGTVVTIAADCDAAGDKYVVQIAATLPRHELRRWRPMS